MPAEREPGRPPGRGARRVAAVAVAAVALGGLVWGLWPASDADASRPVPGATAAPHPAGLPAFSARPGTPGTGADPAARQAALADAQQRLAEARARLDRYRQATVYPFSSRPAAEHADQMYPNLPVVEERPLNDGSDEADESVQVITSQSRVFVARGESVLFTLAARRADGQPLGLAVLQARAFGLPNATNASPPAVPLAFNDQGQNGDATAGDGTVSATWTPSPGAFAGFEGTVRVEVAFRAGDKNGRHIFDVLHTPQLPAVWAGSFRESLEAGSLVLRVPVEVREPGRYLAHARVDDAQGKPVALLSFNDTLPAGSAQIHFTLFGRLVRDARPAFPLTVRDVDGYLLRDSGHPDRALMPRLAGPVLRTASHPAEAFSNGEWQSEQRSRYLTEYGKDVADAQRALDALQAGG